MAKFINPFTDFGFKKLFGEEASKEMLISFLNEILSKETGIITNIMYLNTEQLPETISMRKSFFDIFCKNELGDQFIVELQRAEHKQFMERMVYYSTFPIQNQAIKGQWDFQINALYVIAILDFETKQEPSFTKNLLSYVQLMNRETFEVMYKKLLYVFISMKQFTKTESELHTFLDKWLYVLRNMDKFDRYPDQIKEKILMTFLSRAELAQLDDRERAIYENSLKVYRDEYLVKITREEQDQKWAETEKKYQELSNTIKKMNKDIELKNKDIEVMNKDIELKNKNIEVMNKDIEDMSKKFEQLERENIDLKKQIIQNARNQGQSIESIALLLGMTNEQVIQFI